MSKSTKHTHATAGNELISIVIRMSMIKPWRLGKKTGVVTCGEEMVIWFLTPSLLSSLHTVTVSANSHP